MVSAVIMMLVLGAIVGLLLGFASNVFKVEVDHREEDILAMLPGYNCGGCGYAGCSGMAAAIVDGSGDVDKCKPSKPEKKAEIKQYMADHPTAA